MRFAGALVVALLALGLAASTSAAQGVQCGQVVTHDVTLQSDLTCDAPALTIGADGVTIDLGGHTIAPASTNASFDPGIADPAGHDRVTIRNGTIGPFYIGIGLTGPTRNRIVGLASEAAGFGVSIHGGRGNEIRRTVASGQGNGIEIVGSDDARVLASSGRSPLVGIAITGNSALVAFNSVDGTSLHSAIGIDVTGTGNRIVANRVEFAYNTGIFVSGARNVVLGNNASDGRRARFSPRATGIDVTSPNTLILGNRADRNEDDGIDVEDASDRVIANVANDNGVLGINAVPGVFGLGNRASGNGDPRQCVNVACR